MNYKKEEYNKEPVHYCKNCLSIAIKELKNSKVSVCLDCGNPYKDDEDPIDINEWEILYVKEYGTTFLQSGEELLD